MITNIIYYLYNIKVDFLRYINDKYVFYYNNDIYLFKEVFVLEEYLQFIIRNNDLFHTVVKGKNNQYIMVYKDKRYILMKVKIRENRFVLFNDFYKMKNYIVYSVYFSNFSWLELWKRKIDQIEDYVSHHSLDIYVLSIINYFVGLGELSIKILNSLNEKEKIPLSYAHKRMNFNCDLYSYYDVSNIIIDHYTRDIGEYIKDLIINNKFNIKVINFNDFNYLDRVLLISRIVFPSYFFDLFDQFVLEKRNFNDLDKYIIDIDKYDEAILSVLEFLK